MSRRANIDRTGNKRRSGRVFNPEMNMSGSKGKFWRRRNGSSRMNSLMSNQSQESRTLVDVEEEFLHAAEFGDIPSVRRLLSENTELNVDCIDALGRTALRLAVKNEHLEVVEVLLEKSSSRHIYEAVLQAISAGHVQIAENILKHKRYLELWKDRKKLGDDDHFFKTQFEESQFSPDITPLILASEKNQYEIVQLLLLRGEKIAKPHKFGCLCRECVNKMKFDQLRSAKYRLNAYRGLASEAYISLSSKDPILTAFQLSKELKNLSQTEKYFKQEYKELSDQLSEYVVKLLDRVRTQEELELVLNKTGKAQEEKYRPLARLSLAIQYMEKKFVAHPSCQQRLDRSWFEGTGPFLKAGIFKRIVMIQMFILAYPFLTMLYIFTPDKKLKCLRILRFPWVKFVVHSAAFVTFLLLIVVSTAEATYVLRQNHTLASEYPDVFQKYENMKASNSLFHYGKDIPVRPLFPTITQLLISIWVVGIMYHECTQVYNEGPGSYTSSLYNLMDCCLVMVYTCSFSLKYMVMLKVHIALYYFNSRELSQLMADNHVTQYHLYWLTADRYFWNEWDPINISEGLFAIANILSFSRISYLLPANEALGPLQISLGRMLKDIMKCLCLICVVVVAFVIGLQNLYWYYNVRDSIEVEDRSFNVPAQEFFGDAVSTFRTVFWSVFGRGETTVVTLNEYNNHVTEDIGYVIYGTYNVVMVTVLMNMLIAMMARSYQAITEESDVEWKFARSKLYMEYISDNEVLPTPLNLVRIPRAIFEWIFDCCDKGEEEVPEKEESSANIGNGNVNKIPALSRNGVEPFQHVSQVAGHLKKLRESPSGSIAELSAVDIYEANVTDGQVGNGSNGVPKQEKHAHRHSIPGFLDGNKSYQKVMQRIIQRYIFDIQREAEVTEDDFEEIKQDVSSFRYEMLSVMRNRDTQMLDITTALHKLNHQLAEQNSNGLGKKSRRMRERLQSQEGFSSQLSSQAPSQDDEREECQDYNQLDEEEVGEKRSSEQSADKGKSVVREKSDSRLMSDGGECVVEARTSDEEECYIVES